MKNAAGGADAALAFAQIRGTAKHRKIFDALEHAANGVVGAVSDVDVVALIKCIEVEEVSFLLLPPLAEAILSWRSRNGFNLCVIKKASTVLRLFFRY